jgi:hypothetical protein
MEKTRCLFIGLTFLLLTGCASTTVIQTTPSEAKLYIDGAYVGVTPYSHRDTKIVGSSMIIKLEKEGYKPLVSTITRDEEVDVGAVIGGLFCTVPFLWTMKYAPVHEYRLTQIEGEQTVSSPNAPKTNYSKADKLRELKKLVDEHIITEADFEKEKTKILEAAD